MAKVELMEIVAVSTAANERPRHPWCLTVDGKPGTPVRACLRSATFSSSSWRILASGLQSKKDLPVLLTVASVEYAPVPVLWKIGPIQG